MNQKRTKTVIFKNIHLTDTWQKTAKNSSFFFPVFFDSIESDIGYFGQLLNFWSFWATNQCNDRIRVESGKMDGCLQSFHFILDPMVVLTLLSDGDVATFLASCCDMHVSLRRLFTNWNSLLTYLHLINYIGFIVQTFLKQRFWKYSFFGVQLRTLSLLWFRL